MVNWWQSSLFREETRYIQLVFPCHCSGTGRAQLQLLASSCEQLVTPHELRDVAVSRQQCTSGCYTNLFMQVDKNVEREVIMHSTLQHPNVIGFKRVGLHSRSILHRDSC